MSEHQGYARCKACDMSIYPSFNPQIKGGFEELCSTCINIATQAARSDSVLFGYDGDMMESWIISDESDIETFAKQYADDVRGIPSDHLTEDEYYQYGEGSMGSLTFFDQ